MNSELVDQLLIQWDGILTAAEVHINEKINKFSEGRHTRIRRTEGRPVVFDFKTALRQREIQDRLGAELPQLANIIRSEPALQGYNWKVGDYVELYLQHYRLVIQKIKEVIANVSN